MKIAIIIDQKEYNELLSRFVDNWINQQSKSYGFKLVNNTGIEIIDKDTLIGYLSFIWKKTFKNENE